MGRINRRMRADMTAEQFESFRTEMRRARKANNLTVAAFAELAECSAGHINSIEHGNKYPSNELAEDIASLLGTTVSAMCGGDDRKADENVMRNFGKSYLEKRIARGFTRTEVAGFTGITKECLMDFEDGKCSVGESILEKLNRLYAVKKEVETVEVVKEVAAECPISLELIDTILGHLIDISISKDEKLDMFRKLSEARTNIIEKQIFG